MGGEFNLGPDDRADLVLESKRSNRIQPAPVHQMMTIDVKGPAQPAQAAQIAQIAQPAALAQPTSEAANPSAIELQPCLVQLPAIHAHEIEIDLQDYRVSDRKGDAGDSKHFGQLVHLAGGTLNSGPAKSSVGK